jgi:hypothetical protein
MPVLAITILLLVGTVFGTASSLWLLRRLGRAANTSNFWEGIFCHITGFMDEPKTVSSAPEPKKAQPPKVDEEKFLTDALRSELGFTAKETKDAISYVKEFCPSATIENKIYSALCFLNDSKISARATRGGATWQQS